MTTFDLAIIGAGVAGAFAAFKIAKEHKNIKTVLFDIGRPPQKRRQQMNGFLGCLPSSDGKLYLNDVFATSDTIGNKRAKVAENWVNKYLANICENYKIIKDKAPSVSVEKRIKKNGFNLKLNNYIQIYPKDIHCLSKFISNEIYNSQNIKLKFDEEVYKIIKHKNYFTVVSSYGEINCKRIIIAVGRSGWRWAYDLYKSFGIIENNDVAKFGIRIEIVSEAMKEFNKSNCSIYNNDLEIGPLCWNGTVIPEDHIDFAISAFRSNENRWETDKVSFNLIGNRIFDNNGFEQTSRIGQLAFILSNDRISREKVSSILNGKSRISIIPEYNWLKMALEEYIGKIMPEILLKGYFHIPTILPLVPKITIGNNLLTEIDGMYCAGESCGVVGILAAAMTGITAVNSACR